MLARSDQFVAIVSAYTKPLQTGLNVELGTAFYSQLRLHDASRARENVVGVAVATMMRSMSCGQCAPRRALCGCLDAQITGGLRGFGDMTLADAGARPDPFVVVSICLAKSSLVTTFGGK